MQCPPCSEGGSRLAGEGIGGGRESSRWERQVEEREAKRERSRESLCANSSHSYYTLLCFALSSIAVFFEAYEMRLKSYLE